MGDCDMAKLKKRYDAVIFGGGFSGLLSAHILKAKGKSVLIVEPSDKLGGRLSAWKKEQSEFPSNLNVFSYSQPEHKSFFDWLENTLETRVIDGSFSVQTSHFKDGQLKPLTGFGERNYEALDEYNFFCLQSEKARLTQLPHFWVQRLHQNLEEHEFCLNSEISAIKVENKTAKSLMINGKSEIEFEHIIWATAPQRLLPVVGGQNLSASEAKKLKRPSKVFDAVMLNLIHPNYQHETLNPTSEASIEESQLTSNWPLLEHPEIFCLYGSQDEFEPVIGTLSKNFSCWMTLVPAELSLDNEFVAKVIRNMKKQIKRPFPDLFDSAELEEKIILSESAYGHLSLKEDEKGFLKDINNLFCASSLCSAEQGLFGALDRAQKLENSLV